MIKSIRRTPSFKRDYKRVKRKHYEENQFIEAIKALVTLDTRVLASKFKDHALTGDRKGYRELNIQKDWLLIYRRDNDELQLVLTRTGSHDDLF